MSVEDHRKVAAEIASILESHTRILELINGKVPVRILDQLLTFRGVDKATSRLRSDLDDEYYRIHHLGDSVYYPGDPKCSICTRVQPYCHCSDPA